MTVTRILWWCLRIVRPPLTSKALHGWACPSAITISDDSFKTDGCDPLFATRETVKPLPRHEMTMPASTMPEASWGAA